jgi:cytochrome c oxidase cbb3-type subunit 3
VAVEERDPYTGFQTTGHEWNGIKELNTPVPRAVYVFLVAAFLFAVAYWFLMPAWPTGGGYTKGLLGRDDRAAVMQSVQQAELGRQAWTQRIETENSAQILADPKLMEFVRSSGRTLFGDNCAVCHGADGKGGTGYPSLVNGTALWGRTPEALAETIRVGINSGHPESRQSQMLAFGRDGMLQRPDIDKLSAFVRSLSNPSFNGATQDMIAAGRDLFAKNCASCHGEDGKGKADLGAPDLTDASWIYGGEAQSILTSIWDGRQGHMPNWDGRLSPIDRKILALYVADLGKGAK